MEFNKLNIPLPKAENQEYDLHSSWFFLGDHPNESGLHSASSSHSFDGSSGISPLACDLDIDAWLSCCDEDLNMNLPEFNLREIEEFWNIEDNNFLFSLENNNNNNNNVTSMVDYDALLEHQWYDQYGCNNSIMYHQHDEQVMVKRPRMVATTKVGQKLELDEIQKHFGVPITKAAKEMNVGLTVLKKRCRELNIMRWPHRKIKSLKSLIANVKEMGMTEEANMLEEHKKMVEMLPEMELTERTKKLRQACFKANYKKRRFQSLALQQESSG